MIISTINLYHQMHQAPEITQTLLSPFRRNSKSGLVCHFLVPAYHLFNIILFHHFLYHFLVHPVSPKLHPGFLSLSRSFYHPGKGDRKSEKKRADMVHSYHPSITFALTNKNTALFFPWTNKNSVFTSSANIISLSLL